MHALIITGVIPALIPLASSAPVPAPAPPFKLSAEPSPDGPADGHPRPPSPFREPHINCKRNLDIDEATRGAIVAQLTSMDRIPPQRAAYFSIYTSSGYTCARWLGTITAVEGSGPDRTVTVHFHPQLAGPGGTGGLTMTLDGFIETYRFSDNRLAFVRGAGCWPKLRGAISRY